MQALIRQAIKTKEAVWLYKTENGTQIVVVQIAGLIARRILSFISPSNKLFQGVKIRLN